MSVSGNFIASGKARETKIRAIVTRADGSIEDHGVVAYWHKNPFKRWAWHINRKLKEFLG